MHLWRTVVLDQPRQCVFPNGIKYVRIFGVGKALLMNEERGGSVFASVVIGS